MKVDVLINLRLSFVDRPSKFKERNGYCGIGYKPSGHRSKLGIDLQSVVSMEILESENGYVEARNDEVRSLSTNMVNY